MVSALALDGDGRVLQEPEDIVGGGREEQSGRSGLGVVGACIPILELSDKARSAYKDKSEPSSHGNCNPPWHKRWGRSPRLVGRGV